MVDKPIVLLIEDDPDATQIIKAGLRASAEVIHTADGAEALRLVEEHMPALILSDLLLPDSPLSGNDIIASLKGDERLTHIPVIVVSASGNEQITRVMEMGCDDYLEKPFTIWQLREKVQQYLET